MGQGGHPLWRLAEIAVILGRQFDLVCSDGCHGFEPEGLEKTPDSTVNGFAATAALWYGCGMRWMPLIVGSIGVAILAALPMDLPVARAGSQNYRADTLPVEKVRRGMKGYGLTVFEGTRPERFGVEVIDVIKNFLPAQDLILVKTMHPRLDVAKTVRGMSGSPIFIDGKMVGAYAYGWSFGSEPVAGVTPIQNMLDDLDRPLPKDIFGWPLNPLPSVRTRPKAPESVMAPSDTGGRFLGAPGKYRLDEHVGQLAARLQESKSSSDMGQRPLATPVLIGGLGSVANGVARELLLPLGLEPMMAGGGQAAVDPAAPEHFEDGGAIAVQLVRGDINVTPMGTVTRVEGDRLVAFGHPMMAAGITALPTAVGNVLWVLAGQEFSVKFGVAARPLGALISDRQASIVVSESATAPTIPVSMHVEGIPGAPKRDWTFEVAHERFMTPSFIAMSLGNALQATGAERQDITWGAESKIRIRGYGDVAISDFGVSIGGTPNPREFVQSRLVSAIGDVLNNPWKQAFVESITTNIKFTYAREIVRLMGVRALEPEIEPGQSAHLELTLVPYAGPQFTRTLTVPLPRYLAGSTVKLSVRPGHAVDVEKANPESLEDLIRNFQDPTYPPRSIVVSYPAGSGVAFKGRVVSHLPPGAADSIRQDFASVSPQRFRAEQRQVLEMSDFMVGSDTVSVKIHPAMR